MINELLKLSAYLKSINCNDVAFEVDILKIAVIGRPAQELKLYQDPKYFQTLQKLLLSLGFKAQKQNAIDLLNSAAYLNEGITQNHLLMTGLSLVSLIRGMEAVGNVLAAPRQNPNPEVAKSIAQAIIKNQGMIKGKLEQFKIPKYAESLKAYVPIGGNLIVQYIDRVWDEVRTWALNNSQTTSNKPIEK